MTTEVAPTSTQVGDKEQYEPPKDRLFTTDRCMVTIKGQELIAAVRKALEAHEEQQGLRARKRRPQPQQAFERTIEAIVSDLAYAELIADYRGIAIPRSKDTLCVKSRYRPWYYGHQLPDILDLMQNAGFITQELGEWKPNGKGQRTLIHSGDRLIELLVHAELSIGDIGRTDELETIRLRNHEKGNQEYQDNETTYRWREEMQQINGWLAKANITFDKAALEEPGYVDTGQRRLYRIFIRRSFKLHGRLYGGFWIHQGKRERLRGLRIDDQPVVGLDYGQAFPRIGYGLVGHDPPEGDLYTLPGLEAYREGIKKVLNAMLNYKRLFNKKPKGTKSLLPPNMTIHEIQERICEHHAPIAHLFGTDAGQELTLIESEVMVSVLLRLKNLGIVALPVHDCIVVRKDHQEIATKVMIDMFRDMVGVEAIVNPEEVDTYEEDDEEDNEEDNMRDIVIEDSDDDISHYEKHSDRR